MSNRRPSTKLTFSDAIEIWLLYWNGEFQNRIAAKFDVNPGRISEIVKERTFLGSRIKAAKLIGK